MKKYTVIITTTAEAELQAAYDWLAERTEHAATWYNNILDAILSLEHLPESHPAAREADDVGEPTYQLIVGNKIHGYRIIYHIDQDRVVITHIRHAARMNF